MMGKIAIQQIDEDIFDKLSIKFRMSYIII